MKTIEFQELVERVADISILVATEVEREAGLAALSPAAPYGDVLKVLWNDAVYYYGMMGRYACVMTMCQMGSSGRDGSTQTATRMIERWSPRALFLVGIAFGKAPTDRKQILGDVLVSTRITSYEPARVGAARTEPRGPSPEVGITLLARARNLGFTWTASDPEEQRRPQFGPLISGEKLIDNPDFKDDFFNRYPDAIGGEMEGVGAYAAAARANIEWIVVKSICDWADGSKNKEFQPLAAKNSFAFVSVLLSEPGLNTALPRPTTTISAEQAPRPPSAQDYILEGITRELRTADRKRQEAGQAIIIFTNAFRSNGTLQLSNEAMSLFKALSTSHDQALEAWLNVYEDASARLLNGSIPFDAFARMLGQEIVELCELPGAHRARLDPRDTCPYPNVWSVYDKLKEARGEKDGG